MSRTIRLTERVMSGPNVAARIDENAGVIRGVKILGRKSANGREYTREAVRAAVGKYEGRSVYTDHRTDANNPRSVRDKFGWFENVKPDANDELFGDFHYLKSHAMAAPTLEAARRRPDLFGFSHDAVGRAKPGSNDTIIESIDEVNSVDLVSDPATVNSLFEHLRKRGNPMGKRKRFREIDEYGQPVDDTNGTPGAAGDAPAHGADLLQAICDLIDRALESADSSALDSDYIDKLEAIKDICESHQDDDEPDDTSSQESRRRGAAGRNTIPLRGAVQQVRPKDSKAWLEMIESRARASKRRG